MDPNPAENHESKAEVTQPHDLPPPQAVPNPAASTPDTQGQPARPVQGQSSAAAGPQGRSGPAGGPSANTNHHHPRRQRQPSGPRVNGAHSSRQRQSRAAPPLTVTASITQHTTPATANRGSLESEADVPDDTQSVVIFWQLTDWRQKSKVLLTLGVCLIVIGVLLLILSSITHLRFHQGFDPGLGLTLTGSLMVVIAAALYVKAPLDWKAEKTVPPDPTHQRPLVLSGNEKISPGAARVIYRRELEEEFVKIETDGVLGTHDLPRNNTPSDIRLVENERRSSCAETHEHKKQSKSGGKSGDKSKSKLKESRRSQRDSAQASPRTMINVPSYTRPVMPKY